MRNIVNRALADGAASMALLVLDLDHFKAVNDIGDRADGDHILKTIADQLRACAGTEGAACRLEGDEFAIALPNVSTTSAADMAHKVLGAATASAVVGGNDLVLTASVGIALAPRDGVDFETLFRNANLAMYKAKLDGRNCWRAYVSTMYTNTQRSAQIVARLGRAIAAGTLELHYQPQIGGHAIVGAEALVRWHDEVLGPMQPSEFIPAAEASGLIVALDDWVLRTATLQARSWLDAGIDTVIGVNVSPLHFRIERFYECVVHALDSARLPPRNLEIEITEGAAMHDPNGAIALLEKLHALGLHIAMDDFGIGYSSLSYLKRFRLNRLKIDKSFVDDIANDPNDRAIVKTIIAMARNLGLETVAEGVETQAQRVFLATQGCEVIQGYLYSKALPPGEFEAFWRAWGSGVPIKRDPVAQRPT